MSAEEVLADETESQVSVDEEDALPESRVYLKEVGIEILVYYISLCTQIFNQSMCGSSLEDSSYFFLLYSLYCTSYRS